LLSEKNSYKPISRVIGKQAYKTCFDINSPQGSVFPDLLGKLESVLGQAGGYPADYGIDGCLDDRPEPSARV